MKLLVEIQDNVYKSLKNNRGTAIENVMAIAAVIGGQPLPDGCEILTKEAYADLCIRASKGNCSEIPIGSTTKNDLGVDAVSRKDVHDMLENLPVTVESKWFNWLQKACMRLAELPSVTPQETRKGHWVTRPHVYGVTYCSECGFELKIDNTNYCPNCSADMRTSEEK